MKFCLSLGLISGVKEDVVVVNAAIWEWESILFRNPLLLSFPGATVDGSWVQPQRIFCCHDGELIGLFIA